MLDIRSYPEVSDQGLSPDSFSDFPLFDTSRSDCPSCARLIEQVSILRAESGFWRSCHKKALEREVVLKRKIEELEAKVRLRERQLFARKSEKTIRGRDICPGRSGDAVEKRKRGQQQGSKGHGRVRHENLPSEDEFWSLPESEQVCPCCGLPLRPYGSTADSELIEVDVRAYRRIIRRRRYERTCSCPGVPRIITAPGPAKLIPKGGYGISFWVHVLLGKFLYQRPTYRMLTELREGHGFKVSPGTITGGQERLRPLFVPLYKEIVARNLSEGRWHADETRWLVFAEMEGEVKSKWYLWIFCSKTTVVFRLEPSRSSDVPRSHFGEDVVGILVVDRYSAYKVLLKNGWIILAYCWVHVRRDFLGVAQQWPKEQEWAFEWVKRIGLLYALNKARLEAQDAANSFDVAYKRLKDALRKMALERDRQLSEPHIHPARKKVLKSLKRHWEGLTVFLDHPEVPMDNNYAERNLRLSTLGRKNYYGSGSFWSAALAVMAFSLFQTLRLWNINIRLWLTEYLNACAENGCKAPSDAASFLPWNMDKERLRVFTNPEQNERDRTVLRERFPPA